RNVKSGRLDSNQRSRAPEARDHSGLVHALIFATGQVARAPSGTRTRTPGMARRHATAYIMGAKKLIRLSKSAVQRNQADANRHHCGRKQETLAFVRAATVRERSRRPAP